MGIWQNFKDFFTISNTIVTFSIGMLLFQLLESKSWQDYIFQGSIFLIMIAFIHHFILLQKIKKERKKANGKKWLLEDSIYHFGNISSIFSISIYFWSGLII